MLVVIKILVNKKITMLNYSKILFLTIFTILWTSISFNSAYAKGYSTVNKFAWVASLQTINFMPLSSADPFAGVIITDWYSIGKNVRYKANVYILSGVLNANTVKVKIFKQRYAGGRWEDINVNPAVDNKIEDAILNKARILRNHATN